jgi:hypothetical protein
LTVTFLRDEFEKWLTGEQDKVIVLPEHLDQLSLTQKVVSFDMMTLLATSGAEMMQLFAH